MIFFFIILTKLHESKKKDCKDMCGRVWGGESNENVFGHKEKKRNEVKCPRRRGKPAVRWKDRVKEYMHER